MMYIGVMGLVILPLFFVVCARMIANSDFGKTAGGKTMEVFFYFFTATSIAFLILILLNI